MNPPLRTLLLFTLLLAPAAPAQVGWRDDAFANPTTSGSSALLARVHYPATQAGQNAPLRSRAGGYPIVVFLHGYGGLGRNYPDLGDRLAAAGFIAVLSDTARIELQVQRDDGIALLAALRQENARTASFWFGSLDTARAAVCGHSMGGGNTVRVLSANPGYRAGICFAPFNGLESTTSGVFSFAELHAPRVAVPLLILHGEGDTTLDWQRTAQAYYDKANGYTGMKVFVRLDGDCTHMNVARLDGSSTAVDRAVFQRSLDSAVGWLAAQLEGRAEGLEQVVGPALRAEPRLAQLQSAVRRPALWSDGPALLGGTVGLRLAGEGGPAVLLIAAAPADLPTPFGRLRLDPATTVWLNTAAIPAGGLQRTDVPIPNDPLLLGARAWLQGAAQTDGVGLRLSNAIELVVTRR